MRKFACANVAAELARRVGGRPRVNEGRIAMRIPATIALHAVRGFAEMKMYPNPDNQVISIIKYTPQIEDYGKYLICKADNPAIPDSGIEDRWNLDVQCVYPKLCAYDMLFLIFEPRACICC
ncbi:hypothetical protein U1Q18_050292 [Sarracenia purpurea var. burkii]